MREHPERIPIPDCQHGFLYRIYSRNLNLGVYREDDKGFVGIRLKMGHRYLFTEFHWDTGPPFGTANPLELIAKCPIDDLTEGHIDQAAKQYHENQRLFQWIDEQAAILGITPESE